MTKRLDPLFENFDNQSLRVTPYRELGFRNRFLNRMATRNRHFTEIDEDIMSDLNDFESNSMSKSFNLKSQQDESKFSKFSDGRF